MERQKTKKKSEDEKKAHNFAREEVIQEQSIFQALCLIITS